MCSSLPQVICQQRDEGGNFYDPSIFNPASALCKKGLKISGSGPCSEQVEQMQAEIRLYF